MFFYTTAATLSVSFADFNHHSKLKIKIILKVRWSTTKEILEKEQNWPPQRLLPSAEVFVAGRQMILLCFDLSILLMSTEFKTDWTNKLWSHSQQTMRELSSIYLSSLSISPWFACGFTLSLSLFRFSMHTFCLSSRMFPLCLHRKVNRRGREPKKTKM